MTFGPIAIIVVDEQ